MSKANSTPRPNCLQSLADVSSVGLWLLETDGVEPELFSLCQSVLSVEEQNRAQRFRFDRDRIVFILAHGLKRVVLSLEASCDPKDLRFDTNRHGCPYIVRPPFASRIRFNISHTHGLVGIATSTDSVGLDIERSTRDPNLLEFGDNVLASSERAALYALEPEQRSNYFLRLWVLKESYIKARGLGLALDLTSFSFDLADDRIHFCPPSDDPNPRSFHLFRHVGRHLVAVCAPKDVDLYLEDGCVPLWSRQPSGDTFSSLRSCMERSVQ